MTENEKKEFMMKLITGKKYGGYLDKWGEHYYHRGHYIGIIADDKRGLFCDGAIVTTSTMLDIHDYKGDKILETSYSYYYLGKEGTTEELSQHYEDTAT